MLARRPIRSYVLRQSRLTKGQSQAIKLHWSKYGIDFTPTPLELDTIFDRSSPKILDIGSGMGETTAHLAKTHADNDYLAVEVHRPGVGSLIKQAQSEQLSNIRIICHDVIEVLKRQIPNNSVDETYIFFPDPWHKKRHHKRRLVSADFLSLLSTKLKRNARLFIATDWQELAEYMLTTCDTHPDFINLAGEGRYAPSPEWRPTTKFEQRGKRLNHSNWELVYTIHP